MGGGWRSPLLSILKRVWSSQLRPLKPDRRSVDLLLFPLVVEACTLGRAFKLLTVRQSRRGFSGGQGLA